MTTNKRQRQDVMKLMMSDYEVHIPNEALLTEFCVKFNGPSGTPYEDGQWKIHVSLPKDYPFKSPSIGFINRLYHPNVDDESGSVCLDVINQTWSPMFDLLNIFDHFLPQLLRYPNPSDPLNGEAARMLLKDPEAYNRKVKEYVKNYASRRVNLKEEEAEPKLKGVKAEEDSEMDSDNQDDISDLSDMSDVDDD